MHLQAIVPLSLFLLAAAFLAPKASGNDCGTWLTDEDFPGTPIVSEKGHSHNSCVSLCSVTDSCSHGRYQSSSGKCELLDIKPQEPRKRDGYDGYVLCGDADSSPLSDGSVRLPDVDSPATVACGTWLEDHDVRGTPMSSESNHTRTSCEQRCFEADSCGHVRLRTSDGKCELLDTTPQVPRPRSGYESLQLCFKGSGPAPPGFERLSHDDGECIVRAVTEEVSDGKNAEVHAEAIAEAFSVACAKGDDVNVEDFDSIFRSEDAFAFAQTMAQVQVKCFSTSQTYSCVKVEETAAAIAQATAFAHADAVAAAVTGCGCLTEAVANTFATSEVYLDLVAKATSTATASACTDGVGSVKANAYNSCISKVYGKVFAEATAEALTQGDCISSAAVASVLTEAVGEFDAFSTCGATAAAIAA